MPKELVEEDVTIIDRYRDVPEGQRNLKYGKLRYELAQLTRWGEVTTFSVGNRWNFLMIVQAIIGLWYLGFAIAYLVEDLGTLYISQWAAMLTYAIGGFLIVIIAQAGALIVFYRYNNGYMIPEGENSNPAAYLGQAHFKELVLAFIVSIIVWVFGFWILLDFLTRFGGTCCSGPTTDPSMVSGLQFNTYKFDISVFFVINILGAVWMLRAFYAHLHPLSAIMALSSTPETEVPYTFSAGHHMDRYEKNYRGY